MILLEISDDLFVGATPVKVMLDSLIKIVEAEPSLVRHKGFVELDTDLSGTGFAHTSQEVSGIVLNERKSSEGQTKSPHRLDTNEG